MTKADSVHSTPPTNTSATRRRFLSQSAGVAAGGAVLALAIPAAPAAANAPRAPAALADPIFGAIEAHKAARAIVYSAVDAVSAREKHLEGEGKRCRDYEGDAHLKQCEAALSRAFEAETEAACSLVSERPTTMPGVMALLQYAIAADTDGEGWPSDLVSDDDGKTRSWHFFLIESLAEVLPGMVAS